jgi:hypothetical protein
MYIGLVMTVLATVVPYVDRVTANTLADHIRASYPRYTRGRIDTAATGYLVCLSVVGVSGVVGWLWSVRAVRAGKRWARLAATTLFALGTSIALIGLFIKDVRRGRSAALAWCGRLGPVRARTRRRHLAVAGAPTQTIRSPSSRCITTLQAMPDSTDDRRTETQSIETAASRDAVVALLADATRLPEWAPGFVDQVAGDAQSGWVATKDGRTFTLRVVVEHSAGTVDYLREVAPGREAGAYLRAVPRPGGGSVIAMTLPFQPGVDPADTASTLAQELNAIVSLIGST